MRPHAIAIDREAHARDPVFRYFQLLGRRGARGDTGSWQDDCCGLYCRRPWQTDRCAHPRRVRHPLAHQRHPSGGGARPQRIEAYLALGVGILVVVLALWMLWTQRDLLALAMGAPGAAAGEEHDHAHAEWGAQPHAHDHAAAGAQAWHSHGWGTAHAHRLDLVTADRPKLPVLLALGIAGGLLPDPAALALLLAALSSGKVLLGLTTVLVFSLGFAATLVVVGIVAAKIGQRIMQWLDSIWMVRVQILTTLLILGMGLVLTLRAAYEIAQLAG
jgi:nickel/cobalt transporter (NicO) family protein